MVAKAEQDSTPLIESGAADTATKRKDDAHRSLGSFGVAVVCFAAVAGGPYGIETSVGACGALPTLLGIVGTCIAWSATQALVTAELSTMMPSNAGYVAWVNRGLGPIAGFINAWNCMLSFVLSLPLYPVLFASYVTQLFPAVPTAAVVAIKFACVIIAVILNVLGVEAVEAASATMTALVQTPFILMPITAAVTTGSSAFTWSALGTSQPGWLGQFAVFISTLCWNQQGWSSMGNVAGEVKNPQRSFPVGTAAAVAMVAVNYLYPVAVGVAQAPDTSQWDTGYFVTLAQNTGQAWLGYWTLAAGSLSCMSNFIPQLTTSSRAMRATAQLHMLPVPFFARNATKYKTPVPAILLQAVVVSGLMFMSFNSLVVIEILFQSIGLMLQFGAFLRLKHTEPDAVRPFTVPGGKLGAWALCLLFFSLLGMVVYSSIQQDPMVSISVAGVNAALLIGAFVWKRVYYTEGMLDGTGAEDAE